MAKALQECPNSGEDMFPLLGEDLFSLTQTKKMVFNLMTMGFKRDPEEFSQPRKDPVALYLSFSIAEQNSNK